MDPVTTCPAADPPADPAAWGLVLDVVAAQVGDTARQIEAAVTRVCASFRGIAARSREAAAHAGRAAGRAGDDPVAAARETIAGLLARMAEVQRVTERAAEQVRRIEGIAAQVGRLHESLGRIDAIAQKLRILALNARIEAARAGEQGKAFGVVASETVEVSAAIRDTSRAVHAVVDALQKDVTESTLRMRECVRADRAETERGAADGARALDALARAHAEMGALVGDAAANADRLAADIADAVTALQFQDAVGQQLDHVAAALGEVRAALPPPPAGAPADWAARLRKRYTMRSERDVLDQQLGRDEGNGSGVAAEAGSIELF